MVRKSGQDSLLSTMARKLGHAAGALANMTHLLAKEETSTGSRHNLESRPGADGPRSSAKRQKRRGRSVRVPLATSRAASRRKTTGKKRTARKKA